MADDFDSVLLGIKDEAQEQNASNSTPPVDVPAAPVMQSAATTSPELQGVLGEVKDMARPIPIPTAPRTDADLDKEISDHQKQQQAYEESQKPSEIGKAASALLPGNPFANLTHPEEQFKAANDFFTQTVTGRVADAFGHAAVGALGEAVAMKTPVTEEDMKKYPINGEDKWQNAINEYVVRPAIETGGNVYTLANSLLNLGSVPFSATASGAQQAAEESGNKDLQKEVGFLTQPEILGALGGHVLAANAEMIKDFMVRPPLPFEVSRAVDNRIIEPSDPSIKVEAAEHINAQSVAETAKAARLEAQKGLVTSEVTPGVHDIVRQDNPELFDTYDKLTPQLEIARQTIHDPEIAGKDYDDKLADLKAQREQNLRLPVDLSGEELDVAVKTAHERDTEIAAQIKELGNRNKYIADSKAAAQDEFIKLDSQLRDITPKVNEAYAAAMAKAKDIAFAPPEAKPFSEPVKAVEGVPAFDIAADVKQKLSAEGRTKEQAEAESKIIAARYETAAANGWAKGTAEELYKKHIAEIKSDKESKKKSRGDILLASKNSGKAIVRLFAKSDASTLMHEMAHHWLDEMVGWEKEEGAPQDLKAHMQAVREWLGDKTGDLSGFTKGQHERFARGFERYLREGTAPSIELANAFAHFKEWLTNIYKSVAKLRVKLSPEVQNVFDHMLAVKPERIAIAEEAKKGETNETVNGTKATEGKGEVGNAAGPGGEAGPDIAGKEAATGVPEVVGAVGEGKAETGGGRESRTEGVSKEAGAERGPVSKPAGELLDKAGNIVIKNLTTDQEVIAGLKLMAEKTQLLEHGVVGDVQVGELARELGKEPDKVMERLQSLSAENGIPVAAYVRALRDMLANASQEVREFAGKVKGGTAADFQNAMEAKDRFMMIASTVSETANEIGRALRAFQDITGSKKSDDELHELLQQSGSSKEKMERLFQIIADKDAKNLQSQVPKILQAAAKPGFWDKFSEWRRCSILSNYITHGLWLAGTGVNIGYKALVLDTLGGIHNELGRAFLGREDTGSRVSGGIEGLYHAISKALPNILSATGTALTTGKTVLRPLEGANETYLATGGIRKVLNVNMDELKKATDSAFDINQHPEIKALQDKADAATDPLRKEALQRVADEKITAKKSEIARVIAAKMQLRLKTWGELMDEMHQFGTSAAAAVSSVGKNLVDPDFYKDKKLLEFRSEEGKAVPDIYVKGLNVAPIGSIMRGTSGRIYSTMHTFSRELAANIEITQMARRTAIAEGKTGDSINTRMADLLSNPTESMMKEVNHIANKQTLMSNDSEFAKAVTRARNAFDKIGGMNLGSIALPVVGVPAEAVHQTVTESSPVGLLNMKQRGKLTGEEGALEQERAQVKMLAGTALLGMGAWLYYNGVTTPSTSINFKQNQELTDAGKPGASLRVGDWMLPLSHVPVVGNLMTMGADLAHINEVAFSRDLSDKLKPAIGSAISNFFLHENALVELAQMMDAARGQTDPMAYAKNFTTSMVVPQFIKATSDLTDPNVRESKSLMSSVISKIPGESETAAPKINPLTGEPVLREPLHIHSANGDPIAQALSAIHVYPATPHPEINKVELTTQQTAEYASIKGHILNSGLQMLIQGDGKADFAGTDADGKRKMVQRIELHASQCAKSAMFNRHPELLQGANDRYEASCANELQ